MAGQHTQFVYIQSEPSLWTVGFYGPDGKFDPESDHGTPDAAAQRVHYLNGGNPAHDDLVKALKNIESILNMNALTRRGLGVKQSEALLANVRAALSKAGAA